MNNRDTIEIKLIKSISSLQSLFLSFWIVLKIPTWIQTFKTLEWCFTSSSKLFIWGRGDSNGQGGWFKTILFDFYHPGKRKNVWSTNHKLNWYLNLLNFRIFRTFEFAELSNSLNFQICWTFELFLGYIDVGDGCWRRNVLVTILRFCWRFWPFSSSTSSIY